MGLVAALEWLGQPYRLSRVDMLGEMRTPPYGRLNPRFETPVLIAAEGHVITETWRSPRTSRRETPRGGSASTRALRAPIACISSWAS